MFCFSGFFLLKLEYMLKNIFSYVITDDFVNCSRFSHPNIVKFLGVCFEQRPKLIILELLEGGDLRSFLRESRPKPVRISL